MRRVNSGIPGHPEASRLWESQAHKQLTEAGCTRTAVDHSLYLAPENKGFVICHDQIGDISLSKPMFTPKRRLYTYEMGKCAKWWRETIQTLESMNLADDNYFVVVLDLLDGDAREEFWQRLETLVESKAVSRPYVLKDVKLVVDSMVELFDAGQHTSLLLRHRALSQVKGETTVKFRARFMRVINALKAYVYGYKYTQTQLVHDFSSRLRKWKVIAAHKPTSLDAILESATCTIQDLQV